jgi:hypothetical protein
VAVDSVVTTEKLVGGEGGGILMILIVKTQDLIMYSAYNYKHL